MKFVPSLTDIAHYPALADLPGQQTWRTRNVKKKRGGVKKGW